MVRRTERLVDPRSRHSSRQGQVLFLERKGSVDPNVASQAACLAVIFAISLGKERLVKVRGSETESSQQSMGSVLPSGTNTSAKSGSFGVGCDDDNPPDHNPERDCRRRVYFVDQWSIKHPHRNVVVGLCQRFMEVGRRTESLGTQ